MVWQDIINDASFQAQPSDVKERVANNYFDKRISDNEFHSQNPEIKNKIRNNFLNTINLKPSPLFEVKVPPELPTEITPKPVGLEGFAKKVLSTIITPPVEVGEKPATTVPEFVTKIAKGIPNILAMPVQIPAQVAYSVIGEPLQKAVAGAPAGEVAKQVGKGLLDFIKGAGEFHLNPFGYKGYKDWAEKGFEGSAEIFRAAKDYMLTDPVMSVAGIVALFGVGKSMHKMLNTSSKMKMSVAETALKNDDVKIASEQIADISKTQPEVAEKVSDYLSKQIDKGIEKIPDIIKEEVKPEEKPIEKPTISEEVMAEAEAKLTGKPIEKAEVEKPTEVPIEEPVKVEITKPIEEPVKPEEIVEPIEVLEEKIAEFPITKEKATELDITYNGMQELGPGKESVPLYTDNKTGSSFMVKKGQTVESALADVRERFEKPVEVVEEIKPIKEVKPEVVPTTVHPMDIAKTVDIKKPESITNLANSIVNTVKERIKAVDAKDEVKVKELNKQIKDSKTAFWAHAEKEETKGLVTRDDVFKAWDEIAKAEESVKPPKEKALDAVANIIDGEKPIDATIVDKPEIITKELEKIPEPTSVEIKAEELALEKERKIANMKAIRIAAAKTSAKKGKPIGPIEPLKEEIESAPKAKDLLTESEELAKLLADAGELEGFIEEPTKGGERRKYKGEERTLDLAEELGEGRWIISEDRYRVAKNELTGKGKFSKLYGGGPDLEYIKNLTIWFGYHIERGVRGFENAAKLAIEKFGEQVRPYIHKSWSSALTKFKLETEVLNNLSKISVDPLKFAKFKTISYKLGAETVKQKIGVGTVGDYYMARATVNDLPSSILYLSGAKGRYGIQNPVRAFKYMQDANPAAPWMDVWHQYHDADNAYFNDMKLIRSNIDKAKSSTSTPKAELTRRLAIQSIARQPYGLKILEYMGIKSIPKATVEEVRIYEADRKTLDKTWIRLNETRLANGLEPIGYIENYFTFERVSAELNRKGDSLATAPASTIRQTIDEVEYMWAHPKATKFQYIDRDSTFQSLSLDYFDVYSKYMDAALRHIHITPVISRVRALISKWDKPAIDSNETSIVTQSVDLKKVTPKWSREITEWADTIAGKPPIEDLPEAVKTGLFRLRNNIALYQIVGNVRSAAIQFSSLAQSLPYVRMHLLPAIADSILHPIETKKEYYAKSHLLESRAAHYETAMNDLLDATKRIIAREPGFFRKADMTWATFQKVGGDWLGYLLKVFDARSAVIVYDAAERLGKSRGFKEQELQRFADEIVNKSQASALPGDISPLQRRQIGRSISLFQTFNINQWGSIIEDCLGIAGGKWNQRGKFISGEQAAKNILWLAGGYAAVNLIYEDILGIGSPYPTPFRRMAYGLTHGEGVAMSALKGLRESTELVPFVGGISRYGSHPLGAIFELLGQTSQVISGRPGPKPSGLELGGKYVGVPAGSQMKKSYMQIVETKTHRQKSLTGKTVITKTRRINPELDLYNIIMGTYSGKYPREAMIKEILDVQK